MVGVHRLSKLVNNLGFIYHTQSMSHLFLTLKNEKKNYLMGYSYIDCCLDLTCPNILCKKISQILGENICKTKF